MMLVHKRGGNKEEIMYRYLITIIMALVLLPSGLQAASTLHWFAGPNGSITNGTVTVSGSTEFTETLLNYQRSRPITAIPNAGYQFRNYSGINFTKTTTNPVTTVDNGTDQKITANFASTVLDVITHGLPADVVEMKGGRSHTVLLKKDGTVIAWGGNDGQSNPAIEKLTGVTAIGVGPFNTFLVKDGTVLGYGMFADPKSVSNIPVTVPPLSNVVAVASGLAHAVALKKDGTVTLWCSHNGYGQCSPLPDFNGLKVTAIAAGDNFTLTLMEDGTLRWWGEQKLAVGPNPTTLRDVAAISASVWHAAALLKNGTVVGWGEASTGQPPAGLNNVQAIATGGHHTVALKKDGTVVTWGDLNNAKAGPGHLTVPPGLSGLATAIGTGYYFTLVKTPAAIVAWGENLSNQCNVPNRAYLPITNGTVTCQTQFPGNPDYGVCNIQPDPGLKTFFAVNGIPSTVPEGPTTAKLTGSQSFQSVTAAFGLSPDPPTIGTVSVTNGQATVQLIPPRNDGGSPITGYKVSTKTPSAGLGTDLDAGTTKLSHTITGLTNGTEYTFTATASNLFGTSGDSPPSTKGGVAINGGAAYTKSASVTLTLSANGANGASQVCVSNSDTCLTWSAFSATKPWLLSAGDGAKTVKAWFKDSLGNVSQPYSATINLDASPPVNGALSITPAAGVFTLNWQGFKDTGSDIAGYRLVRGIAAAPACTAAPLYSGTAESYTDSGLVSGTTYYYRVCAVDNAGNISSGAVASKKALAEYDPPSAGNVAIIGGSGYTKSPMVSLALAANDATGVSQVCISNTATCTLWTPYAATKPWTLSAGSGVKTVNVWFKDVLGNVTPEPVSASVTLDATPPTNGTLTITPVPGSFTLNWQGATDALSGIALYRLVMSTTSYPLCSAAPLYTGTANTFTHSGVATGTTYYYRLCTVDKAGNTSVGATAMKKALAEYDPPVGSVSINQGAEFTKTASVKLALAATDAVSGVSQVCVSNSATCTAWAPFSATRVWTLASGNGPKTVNVWFKDALGNANVQPYAASITLDSTPPTNGTLTITPAPDTFTLNWQGATDALSGIAGYKLVSGTTGYPACTAATPLYAGTDTSFVHSVVTGTTYYYRLCTLDKAGNTSLGAIAMKKAVAEYTPPVGSVAINKGAAYTKSALVTLTLSADDPSGVSQVCISNTAKCTLWTSYAATKSWTLPPVSGQKTVNVWFKDRLGNANAQPYTASITLDTTAPTGSFAINDGALSTTSTAVTLTLVASDNSGAVASMQFSNDGITWSPWENFAPTKDWTLASGVGSRRVLARFRDAAGNISVAYGKAIALAPAGP